MEATAAVAGPSLLGTSAWICLSLQQLTLTFSAVFKELGTICSYHGVELRVDLSCNLFTLAIHRAYGFIWKRLLHYSLVPGPGKHAVHAVKNREI